MSLMRTIQVLLDSAMKTKANANFDNVNFLITARLNISQEPTGIVTCRTCNVTNLVLLKVLYFPISCSPITYGALMIFIAICFPELSSLPLLVLNVQSARVTTISKLFFIFSLRSVDNYELRCQC